ncbi:hypothetical protein ANTRET_LOCUS7898 [Anthophora retusa]
MKKSGAEAAVKENTHNKQAAKEQEEAGSNKAADGQEERRKRRRRRERVKREEEEVSVAVPRPGSKTLSQGTKGKLRKEKVARSSAAPAKRGKVNGTRCLLGYPLAPCSSPVNESKLISSSA